MLNGDHLSILTEGVVLVLISLAHLVYFDALMKEAKTNRIKAAIDVFPEEPLPKDHPISNAEKAILSTHRAGSVLQDLKLIGNMVVDDLETMLAGLTPHGNAEGGAWVYKAFNEKMVGNTANA
jgi:phosphoglycerate dehydrogenase-like enzyme